MGMHVFFFFYSIYVSRIPDQDFRCFYPCEIIRIYHEFEGGIEKSVPRITVWHHEACRPRDGFFYPMISFGILGSYLYLHIWENIS